MENYCINCGRDLRNAPYTAPWEDGDNEEGYWTCPPVTPKILTGLPQMTMTIYLDFPCKNKNRQRTTFLFRNTLAVPFYSNASRFFFHAT